MEKTMEKIVALAKARGFVYPGSEIYGGLANTWDYGNLGVELKNNVKQAWWKKFVTENPYNVGVDCAPSDRFRWDRKPSFRRISSMGSPCRARSRPYRTQSRIREAALRSVLSPPPSGLWKTTAG